jgi:hypothetical protein
MLADGCGQSFFDGLFHSYAERRSSMLQNLKATQAVITDG